MASPVPRTVGSSFMRIGVLSNTQAGRNLSRAARLRALCEGQSDVVHLEIGPQLGVEEAVAILAGHESEVLAVCGGDGTLQHVLTALLSTPTPARLPLIAPLKGGRTNAGALDIGSHPNPLSALSRLMQAVRQGKLRQSVVERPVLRVELGPDEAVQYGFFFGVGVIYRTTELKHRLLPDRYFQGPLTSGAIIGLVALRTLLGSSRGVLVRDRMDIQLDSRSLGSRPFLLAFATTLNSLMRLRPFWGQEEAPIHCTAIAEGAPRRLLAPFRIVQGRPPQSDGPLAGYVSHNLYQLQVRLDCGIVIDGELFAPKEGRVVRVEVDRRLQFVRT